MRVLWGWAVAFVGSVACVAAETDQATVVRPSVTPEAYEVLQYFYQYDAKIPLEPRVVELSNLELGVRRKIVYRGVRGSLVPAYLEPAVAWFQEHL